MAHSGSDVLAGLVNQAARVDRLRRKLDTAHTNDAITRAEADTLYAALLLELIKELELSIERYFLGLLCRKITVRGIKVNPVMQVSSWQSARRVVCGGRSYVDWLPYDKHVPRRAEAFFTGGRPFPSKFNSPHGNRMNQLMALRNSIAHRSDHSLRVFRTTVVANQQIPIRETESPGAFLRGIHATSPIQTRLELYSSYMLGVGRELLV